MTIVIDIPSLVAGIFIGYIVISLLFIAFMIHNHSWDVGFSQGWDRGKEYGEKISKEEDNDTTRD